jgi:hypothetical protein
MDLDDISGDILMKWRVILEPDPETGEWAPQVPGVTWLRVSRRFA